MLKTLLRGLPFAATFVLLGCASGGARQPAAAQNPLEGYLTTTSGAIVRSSTGTCWRSGSWRPELAVRECDPEVVASLRGTTQQPPAAQAPAESAGTAAAPADAAAAAPATEPAEPTAAAEPTVIYIGADAYFPFDQAELSNDAKRKVDIVVQRARDADGATIRIVGHADQIGAEDYNLALSQRRADAVRVYLSEQGIEDDAVQVEARGESDPIVTCENRQGQSLVDCLQINRRTEITFSALQPVNR